MIEAYLVDDITLRYLVSLDQWQEPTWSDVAVKARVEWSNKLIRNAQGEQVVSAALVYLAGDVTAPSNADKLIIDGVEHDIMRVNKIVDFSASHFEVYLRPSINEQR